jgi:hypothetical protein
MSSTFFEPEYSSSGRRFYVQLWYGMVWYVLHIEITIKGFYMISKYKIFELVKYIDMNIKCRS